MNVRRASFLLVSASLLVSRLSGKDVDFAREVLPVLSNKCFACHGPDTKQKDLLRLDSEEAAKRDLGGFHAVDEKSPEDSCLLYTSPSPRD